jgi:hypothetical protein
MENTSVFLRIVPFDDTKPAHKILEVDCNGILSIKYDILLNYAENTISTQDKILYLLEPLFG